MAKPIIVNFQTATSLDLTRAEYKARRADLGAALAPYPGKPNARVLTFDYVNPDNGRTSKRRIYITDAKRILP